MREWPAGWREPAAFRPIAYDLPKAYNFLDVTWWRITNMEWTTPSFEEISLNCEISSYSSAEI
jgi:coenzyme PQQ precursor peptide PqqA